MANADLMNFDPEGEGPGNQDENDENDAPGLAPSLVGSPVIKNSILKQSTKDNLIQLFTPVQKPEKGKLKVHFGRDSLLETPNIKQKKKVVIPDSIGEKPADEPVEGGQKQPPPMTDVAVSHEIGVSQQNHTGSQRSSSFEEVAMETSICEIQNSIELDLDSRVLDILSSTEAFLKSLSYTEPTKPTLEEFRQPTPVSEVTSDKAIAGSSHDRSDADKEPIEREKVSPTVNNAADKGDEPEQGGTEFKATDTKSNDVHSAAAITEEQEPMDCEEMMDVDDEEDDEVTFNLKKTVSDSGIVEEVKEEPEENREPEKQQESEEKQTEAELNEIQNVHGNNSVEAEKEVIAEKENATAEVESELTVKTEDIEKQKGVESKQEGANKSEKLKSDDASDEEEFMSADEDMEVDPTTPAKKLPEQAREPSPPLKTPPKIGYSIDFDNFNLDAVDPFSNKKSLMNSPDVAGKTKPASEKGGQTKPATEMVAEQTKSATEKLAENEKSDTNGGIKTKKVPVPEKQMSEEKAEDKIEKNSRKSQEGDKIAVKVSDVEKVSIVKEKHKENQPTGEPVKDDVKTKESQPVTEEEKEAELSIVQKDVKPNEDKNCVRTEPVVHSSSPAIPISRGAYNLDFLDKLDEINPFQPKARMMNSPLINKSGATQESVKDDLIKTKSQIMNSPVTSKTPKVPVNNKDFVEQNPELSGKEECKETDVAKIVPQDKVCKGKVDENKECEKPLAANSLENNADTNQDKFSLQQSVKQRDSVGILELDNIEDIDPFKPKKQMLNSPEAKAKANVNVVAQKEEVDPFEPTQQVANSPAAKSQSENNIRNETEEKDPLKPQKQMANLSVSKSKDKVKNTASGNGKENDPFQTKTQIANSPVSKTDTVSKKFKTENKEEIDPFQPKKQVANSPVANKNAKADKTETIDFKDMDPFKSKKQIVNSPVKSEATVEKAKTESMEEIDPFKPKQQMQNSPVTKPAKAVTSSKQSVPSEVDPFKPKKQIHNSPGKSLSESKEIDFSKLDDMNPFKPRKQMHDSPDKQSTAPVKATDAVDLDTVDPFKPRKQLQMMNSPAIRQGGKATLSQIVEQDLESSSSETSPPAMKPESKSDKEVNKTQSAKEKQALGQPVLDPFADLNPPELRKKENSQLSNKVSLLEGDEDTVEVHGVTRRGQSAAMADLWGDLGDAQFVPASEVFNDPAAWDMLEKIGNNASKETESALSRMSLYVKFDPLVDPAPSSFINPRRISIRAAQLDKVREYGLDETLLLLGTPPKKRRQSMMGVQAANSNRGTPTNAQATTAGNKPPVRKLEPVLVQTPNPVDLILAYSPGKESKPDSSAKPLPTGFMFGADDDEGTEENLFQELKYTDADLRRLRTEMRLEAQGVLIGKEREFCTEREAWEREREEMMKKWSLDCKEYRKLEQIFNMLEKTCYEMSGAKTETENKIVELKKEHEQSLEELAAMERSFWDLHKRYEKTKEMFLNLKKNEETLKKHLEERMEQQRKQEEKYTKLKQMSEEKLKLASQEIERLEQSQKGNEEKLKTEKKISDMKVNNLEMRITNLESMLQKKTEDVKQLTEICDGLLAQVGK